MVGSPAAPTPVPFCLLTTQRSGSTWLVDLLNRHPRMRVYNEVFLRKQYTDLEESSQVSDLYATIRPPLYYHEFCSTMRTPRPWRTFAYLRHLLTHSGEADAVGFKLMYNQLKARLELLLPFVTKGYRIVHLVRSNYLDIIISKELWWKRQVVHTADDLPPEQVFLDPATLLGRLRRGRRRHRRAELLLKVYPVPVHTITYEALCRDQAEVLGGSWSFLGLSPVPVESKLRRTNRFPHWQTIANYDEVRALLAGTEFQGLLAAREEGANA